MLLAKFNIEGVSKSCIFIFEKIIQTIMETTQTENTFTIVRNSRRLFSTFLEKYSLEELNKVPEGYNNNIIWNIGHIIVTQQRIVYSLSGLPMTISEEMATMYMKGTKPERDVTADEVKEIKELLFSTIDQTEEDFRKEIFVNYKEYPTSIGYTLTSARESMDFNNYHEGLHLGIIMSLRKFL